MPQLVSSQLQSEPRDREAQLLAELVRLSPATLLLAESGSDKSTFLEQTVMPLLASSAAAQSEICVLFDLWTDWPLPALLARIRDAIPALDQSSAEAPPTSLAVTLARWQANLGATFIVVLDCFEEHLTGRDRPGASELEDELVDVLTAHELRAHFVIAVDEDAAPLLEPLRARIPGFGDAVIRLPGPSVHAAPQAELDLTGHGAKREPFIGSAPPLGTAAAVGTAAVDEEAPPVRQTPPARDLFGIAGPAVASFRRFRERAAARVESLAAPANRVREPREMLASTEAATSESSADTLLSPQRRLPRIAWAVLGLLIVSAMGLLLSWQRKLPAPEGAHELVASSLPKDVGTTAPPVTITPPVTTAPASTEAAPVASPAEHRFARPIARNDLARARAATANPANKQAARAGPVPRPMTLVYVHVRSEAQRAWAEQLVRPLATRGVRVTGIRVVSAGPRAAQMRFFRPGEANEAARVARVLHEVGLPQANVTRVRGSEKRATPRQYELWLAPETASRSRQRR